MPVTNLLTKQFLGPNQYFTEIPLWKHSFGDNVKHFCLWYAFVLNELCENSCSFLNYRFLWVSSGLFVGAVETPVGLETIAISNGIQASHPKHAVLANSFFEALLKLLLATSPLLLGSPSTQYAIRCQVIIICRMHPPPLWWTVANERGQLSLFSTWIHEEIIQSNQ